jgi:hypothetical protein
MSDRKIEPIKYHAVLVVPDGTVIERATQNYGASLDAMRDWACLKKTSLEGPLGVLEGAPVGSYVMVYEIIERAIARYDKVAHAAGDEGFAIEESKPK